MTDRKAAREDQLLEVAARLFRMKGYHNTSMQDLADALGVQKGSLYYYIDSKEALLGRLMAQVTAFIETQISEIYGSNLSPPQKLQRALENHAQTMMDHLDLVTVYLHEYRNLTPDLLTEDLAVRKRYERSLMHILEEGIANGDFRPVNVRMAAFGMLGMLNWTHQWFSPRGEFTSEEAAARLVDLATKGLIEQHR